MVKRINILPLGLPNVLSVGLKWSNNGKSNFTLLKESVGLLSVISDTGLNAYMFRDKQLFMARMCVQLTYCFIEMLLNMLISRVNNSGGSTIINS